MADVNPEFTTGVASGASTSWLSGLVSRMESGIKEIAGWAGGPLIVLLAGLKAWFSLKECVRDHNVRISAAEDLADEHKQFQHEINKAHMLVVDELRTAVQGLAVTSARTDERTKSILSKLKTMESRQP